MTVPTVIGDLSTTALDNAPSGEDAPSVIDNIQRAHAAFIAKLRDESQTLANKDASGGYAGLTLFKLNLRNAANTFTSFLTNAATAARTWAMPDKDGTVAMTSDITGGTLAGSFTTLATGGNITANNPTATGSVGSYLSTAGVVRAGFSIDHNAAVSYLDVDAALFVRAVPSYATIFSVNSAGIGVIPGGLQVTGAALLGYGTGAGGTVTQATSRTTATAAINKPTGEITLVSAAGSTTPFSFTVNNSLVIASDRPHVVQKSGTDKYIIHITNVSTGTFQITAWTTGGTTTEQPVFGFNLHKGATS